MQPYVTTADVVMLITPLVTAGVLLVLARLVRTRTKGWSQVTPGLSYWLPVVLGSGLALLIAWVWMFVGSAHSDAAFQMRVAWWLCLAFGLMTLWCAWRIYLIERMALRWRGQVVKWRTRVGDVEQSLLGATAIQTRFGGSALVPFAKGHSLKIDVSAAGSSDLLARIEELNGLADPDAPPEH